MKYCQSVNAAILSRIWECSGSETSLVLSRVLVPLLLHSHTRLRIAALKKLATVRAPWRRPCGKNIRTNALMTFHKPLCTGFIQQKCFIIC